MGFDLPKAVQGKGLASERAIPNLFWSTSSKRQDADHRKQRQPSPLRDAETKASVPRHRNSMRRSGSAER